MKRIKDVFSRDRKALVVYLTAGFPEPGADEEMAMVVLDAGADIIELGFPFSDPIADGPIIQESTRRALENGMTLSGTLDTAAGIRAKTQAPIVLMGYANPVYNMGYDVFAERAVRAGVDGAIIPDLPFEESTSLRRELVSRESALIPMAAPNTPPERLDKLLGTGAGFLYVVSMTGLTGDDFDGYAQWRSLVSLARKDGRLPVCLGFGIRSGRDASIAVREADGVIVGSAVIGEIMYSSSFAEAKKRVAGLVRELASSIADC